VYFNEYHSRMRPGSHHMLLYTQTANQPTSDAPVQCNQGLSRNLFGAQQATFDATAISKGPENAGLAVSIAPQQQGVIQVHFINTTSKPMLRETWANVVYIDKANVKILGDPIFFIAGATLNLKMGSTTVSTGTSTVPANADPNFRLVMATGHYHTHTTRFTAYKIINGQKELLFEEWNPLHALPEPGNWLFDTVTKNPAVNEATQSKGAFTGPVYMKPGDQIQWECAVNNDDVSPTSPAPYNANSITFANAVYTGEMCNMFGIYAPTLGCAWNGGQSTALAGSKCSGG
jgi:hypothetical protein